MQDEGCEKAWRGLIKFRSLEEEACETRSHASEKRMLLGRYLSCGYHEAGSANSEKLQTKSICCKGTELLLPVTHSYRKQTGGWEDTANSSPASSLPVSRYCSLLTQPNGSSWQKGTVAHRQGYVQYPKTAYWMMDLEVRDNDFLSGTTGCCNAKPNDNSHVRIYISRDYRRQEEEETYFHLKEELRISLPGVSSSSLSLSQLYYNKYEKMRNIMTPGFHRPCR